MPLYQHIKLQARKGSFSISSPFTVASKVFPPLGNSGATCIRLCDKDPLVCGVQQDERDDASQARCHSPCPLRTPPSCSPALPAVLTQERPRHSVSNR